MYEISIFVSLTCKHGYIAGEIYSPGLQTSPLIMGSKYSKKQVSSRLTKEDVLRKLWDRQTRSFSWCMYRKRNIVRHVGILIKFNGQPFCTVDFGVPNPSPTCIIACVSEVTITQVTPEFLTTVDYQGDIQSIEAIKEEGKSMAADMINKLLTLTDRERYSLTLHNCRHDTEQVVEKVCATSYCNPNNLQATKRGLLETKKEDLGYVLWLFVAILGGVLIKKIAKPDKDKS